MIIKKITREQDKYFMAVPFYGILDFFKSVLRLKISISKLKPLKMAFFRF